MKAQADAAAESQRVQAEALEKVVDKLDNSSSGDTKVVSATNLSLSAEKLEVLEIERNSWDSTQSAEANIKAFKRGAKVSHRILLLCLR